MGVELNTEQVPFHFSHTGLFRIFLVSVRDLFSFL